MWNVRKKVFDVECSKTNVLGGMLKIETFEAGCFKCKDLN